MGSIDATAAPPPLDASITLFLMTEKGYNFLKSVSDRYQHLLKLVVIGSDKSLVNDFAREIELLCIEKNIMHTKRSDFARTTTEYAMAISWRWIIHHPTEKLIVFHDSVLPRYRGFAPLVNSLINGENEIGVTALFGAIEYDMGNIISQSTSQISYPITISEAIRLNNENYRCCAEEVLNKIASGQPLQAIPQDEASASYSVWLDEDDYKIDWNLSSAEIRRFIDAVGYPYKGACSFLGEKLIRIIEAEEWADVSIENRHCGKILFVKNGQPVVICGQGLLRIVNAYVADGSERTPLIPLSKFRIRFSHEAIENASV